MTPPKTRKETVQRKAVQVIAVLDRLGPMSQRRLFRIAGANLHHVRDISVFLMNEVGQARFKTGRTIKTRSFRLFGDTLAYGKAGPIWYRLDEPERLIKYVAENSPMEIRNGRDAQAFVMNLRNVVGTEMARKIVQAKGYEYKK